MVELISSSSIMFIFCGPSKEKSAGSRSPGDVSGLGEAGVMFSLVGDNRSGKISGSESFSVTLSSSSKTNETLRYYNLDS
jgi:hypothetical protein